MYEKIINNLQEYIEVVEEFSADFCLSRGQSKEYPLLPGALRCDNDGKRLYSKTTVNCFMKDFKMDALMYMENPGVVVTDYDYMVLAQHYGVPTRLLDFTYSHMVSLMFAVEKAFSYDEEDEGNSVVWFLNPKELNGISLSRKELINIADCTSAEVEDKSFPVAVAANKNNQRIVAQNGSFVFFQQDAQALEGYPEADKYLKKIIIPHSDAKKILKSLYLLGMRFSNIYPELASISKDIVLKYDVMQYMKEEEDGE